MAPKLWPIEFINQSSSSSSCHFNPLYILEQEELLKELERVYHPNHNLPIDVKFNLVPHYGRQTRLATLIMFLE
jgi:hypothetical protein